MLSIYNARLRHARYYLQIVTQINEFFFEVGYQMVAGLAVFDRERSNIDAAQHWIRNQTPTYETDVLLLSYANATSEVGDLRYNAQSEHIPQLEAALAAARRIGRKDAEGSTLCDLGLAYMNLGDARKAIIYYEQALICTHEVNDRRSEGKIVGRLGDAYYALGYHRRAIEFFLQAWEIICQVGDRRNEAVILGSLGLVYYILGETQQSIAYNQQALELSRAAGNYRSECIALSNIGIANSMMGNLQQAITYHEDALRISNEIGDRRAKSKILGNLGDAYEVDFRRMIKYYNLSLEISRDIGDRRSEGEALARIGKAYYNRGDHRLAIEYYKQALAISIEIGDRRNEGTALGGLGLTYYTFGDISRAIEYYHKQIVLAQEIGHRYSECVASGSLGIAYYTIGDLQQAITYFEEALAISRQLGDRREEGKEYSNLGNVYYAIGDQYRAIEYYKKALNINRQIKDRRAEGAALGHLGNVYYILGEISQAITFYEQRLTIAREIADPHSEATVLAGLGNAHFALGDQSRAITYYEEYLSLQQRFGNFDLSFIQAGADMHQNASPTRILQSDIDVPMQFDTHKSASILSTESERTSQEKQVADSDVASNGSIRDSGQDVVPSMNVTQLPLVPTIENVQPLPKLMIGREDDVRKIKERLGIGTPDTTAVQVLTAMRGWPGIGKTTLAAAIAHDPDVAQMFPDGVLWASLGQSPSIFTELIAWGRALGIPDLGQARTAEEASTQLRAVLRTKRMLLIVDDVWQEEHALAFRVGGSGCALLITTRLPDVARAIAPSAGDVYILGVLTVEKALELLRELAPQVVADHPDVSRDLVQDLEGLPLALQVAGRLLAAEAELGFGIMDLLHDIREGARLIEAQAPADRAEVANETTPTVAALLKKSTDLLNAHDLDCFAYLGAFAPKPATFDVEAMQAVWQEDDPKSTIRALANHGLLEPTGDGRFWMHAILVTHARSFLME